MENTLENELLELLNKYVLPDVNEHPHSSYMYHLRHNIFDSVDFILCFLKWENKIKERNWSLYRIYKNIDDKSDLYNKMVEREIRILKSIHENPNKKN
ncbi:hypothetical protein ATE47_04040 [Chryseobacterium sp. IHB B 17019]|uniref:hypothetical protein n=1 Tax=Chryseobacterium sp. IHB B 17019 TaxID=1721091 RepID=UPI0007206422|nr:hypothetical protein [Chryseobacterium sp. IHB B 17019]ALR29740.1 hypothetical protein ATE47_04040 [Chryseobacterium sp. IHB B 17019]